MKRVKASDRLPDKEGEYYCKFFATDIRVKLYGTPDGFYQSQAMKYTHEGGRMIDIDEIDWWLDESEDDEYRVVLGTSAEY